MFGKKVNKGLIEKNRNYTYEELKEIYRSIVTEVCTNPFGDLAKEMGKEIGAKTEVAMMLMTIPIMHTIEEKLFGKEEL